MEIQRININNIPTLIWGKKSNKVFIAVHGSMSNKEDTVIKILANTVVNKGYQLISFDLPEHGERKDNKKYICNVQNCMYDLKQIIDYVKIRYTEINIFACSMGAYFSLLTYKDDNIKQSIFLSPIVNMKVLIENMMKWSNVSEKELEDKKEIKIDFGQTLYWDYYLFVKNNPIEKLNSNIFILYGTKDNMQERKVIEKFKEKFNCNLNILENGEHYFHTEEQLKYYEEWLNKIIK